MVLLNILSGKTAGNQMVVRRFPFNIGRKPENNLPLEDDGVWDRHLTLAFKRGDGFILTANDSALATVNDGPIQTIRLGNGDVISFGSVKIQFWLAPPRQRGLRLRELFVWALIALVTASQFALIYWLIR